MAKTSGTTRKKFGPNDSKNVRGRGGAIVKRYDNGLPLSAIEDDKLREETTQAISKFESRLGIGTTNVRLGDTGDAVGVHITVDGKSYGILLNTKYFQKGTVASIRKQKKNAYDTGWLTPTNKSVQHTMIHELAHSVWTSHFKSPNAVKAGREINKLWNTFKKETPKAYGKYAFANINEMVAEMVTKHTIGNSDKYSKKLISILAKNKLIKNRKR